MLKIGEFSKLVRVSPRMLRHYEKCGLIRPAEVDQTSGYRHYGANQISTVSRIATLRDLGFSIAEIGEILPRFNDTAYLDTVLNSKVESIESTIATEQNKLDRLMKMRNKLRKELTVMLYDVELKEVEAINVLSLRGIIPQYNQEGILWERLSTYAAEQGITCKSGGYSTYFDEEYQESNPDVEIAIPVDKLGESEGDFIFKEYPALKTAATLRFSGPFDGGYDAACEKLATWMEQEGYEFAGNLRGHVLVDPCEEPNPEHWLTELQVPVRPCA